jgi:hypothetical protein
MAISGPMNLKNFALIGKHPKSEIGLACMCGKDCGGHCRTHRKMTHMELKKLIEYNRIDCLCLYSALTELKDFCNLNDIALKGTIGASAYHTVKHFHGVADANWNMSGVSPSAVYKFARNSYYGGRTQVFMPLAEHGYRYDMNSAYPAALANLDLPVGPPNRRQGHQASRAYASGTPGLYQAHVSVPRGMHIPPLPLRCNERIAYPVGDFYGSWTHLELSYAESVGVTVEKVIDSLTWSESAPILKPFCEHVYALRDGARYTNIGLFKWLKNLGNSLSGKLAQRPDSSVVILGPDVVKACPGAAKCQGRDRCSRARGCCEHTCWETCGVMLPIDKEEYVFTSKTYRLPACGHVHWAAYLTAYARTQLHRQLVDDGQGGRTAIYCDTDSCYSTTPRTRNLSDSELGKWKFEGELEDWESLAPKTYTYKDPATGKVHARSKGIPDAARNWEKLREGVLIDRGVLSLRSAARSGGSLFQRKHMSRRVSPDGVRYGDRTLSETSTLPPDISTIG